MSITYFPPSVLNSALLQFPNGAFHQDGYTTLTNAIPNSSSTANIVVGSTAGFASAGTILIGQELISYTGKTATSFTGITRSEYGSTGSSHSAGVYVSEAQAVPSPTAALAIPFDTTDASNQVSLDPLDNTKVVFAVAGYYNVQFSIQLLNCTSSIDNVTLWFRQNTIDIPNTAGVVSIPSKHAGGLGAAIVSWNLIVAATAGSNIQLMMHSNSGNTVTATYPPGTAPVHPASPSVILTATFVSGLLHDKVSLKLGEVYLMGTGVGEAMLIGAAVGAGTGAAGSAISGGDPMKGALTGAVMGGVTGGIGGYMNPTSYAPGALEGAQAAGMEAGTTALNTAMDPGLASVNFGAMTPQALGQGVSSGTIPLEAANQYGQAYTQAFEGIKPVSPNMLGMSNLTNTQLGMIGGTSALGAAMGAERAMYGSQPSSSYEGPLSKLKYDPNKFTASEPTYAPDSVYRPQYRTYAAEGGLMAGGEAQGYPMNKYPNPVPNLEVAYGMAEGGIARYQAGGTPAELAPAGIEKLMGVKSKGQSAQEMIESAQLQGLTPRAYLDIYGEGIKAQQQMARGGIADLGGYSDGGRMLKGPGDGMSDSIPGVIGGKQPARLADGEFVVPADVVSHLGNGSTDAGAKQLYAMMDKVRKARTGKKKQAPAVKANRYMPA